MLAAMMAAGCAFGAKPVERDPAWILIKAPSVPSFPFGSWNTPQSQWTMVEAYQSEPECRAARFKAQVAQSPRPFACISSDSPDYAAIVKNSGTQLPPLQSSPVTSTGGVR